MTARARPSFRRRLVIILLVAGILLVIVSLAPRIRTAVRSFEPDEEARLSLHLRDGREIEGRPVSWDRDYVSVALDGDRDEIVIRRGEIDSAELIRPFRNSTAHRVWWRYDATSNPVESIEGCRPRNQGTHEVTVFCPGEHGAVEFVIPRQTFVITGWSHREVEDGYIVSMRRRDRTASPEVELVGSSPPVEEPPPAAPPTPPAEGTTDPPRVDPSGTETRPEKPPATIPNRKDWNELYELLEPEIRRADVDPTTRLTFVQACFETERLDEARRQVDLLLEASPAQPEYVYWKGVIHLATEDPGRAIALMETAKTNVARKFPEIHMYLGIAYLTRGNTEKGCEAFRTYLIVTQNDAYKSAVEQQFENHCGEA